MYEFKKQDAFDFAYSIGAKFSERGEELFLLECPYCRGGQHRDKRTFSINLTNGKFTCFRATCGAKGNMLTLAKDFDFSLGREVDEYYQPKTEYRKFKAPEVKAPKDEVVAYFASRGISAEVVNRYQIKLMNGTTNVVAFLFQNESGELKFIKYRKTDFDKTKDKNKEWCEAKGQPILYGMYQCDLSKSKELIITEGQIDSLSVAEAGFTNAVSVPTGAKGFTWVPYCWDWIQQFEKIIVFGDHESGKITLLDELRQRFKSKVFSVRESDYKGCKDANEILMKYGKEQIIRCVQNAVALPVSHVLSLSDVKDINISEIPKLKTTFPELDKLLRGGIPFGGVTLIFGKTGEGKSTLASQICAKSISEGYKTFIYSGELPNSMFKAWFDFQIAGTKNLYDVATPYGDYEPMLSNTNKKLISEWYKGKVYIYDNSVVGDDEQDSLIDVMESTILRYSVKVLLLDNLMTALDLDMEKGTDKYDRQSYFMKKLARLAVKHNVLILLVAHKRKNSIGECENDEISGSADITNLAMLTLGFIKPSKNELAEQKYTENQRKLVVSKNRLFGTTTTGDGIIVNYDSRSRRLYSNQGDINMKFGWEVKDDFVNEGFEKIDDDVESPFY